MDQAHVLQHTVLQIPLDGVKLDHRVRDRRAGGKNNAAPTGNLVQIPAFHKQVGGFLGLGLGDAAHIAHLGCQKKVLKIMTLIHKDPIHAQLLKGYKVVLAALIVELCQLGLQRFPGALQLLDGVSLRLCLLGVLNAPQDFPDLLL